MYSPPVQVILMIYLIHKWAPYSPVLYIHFHSECLNPHLLFNAKAWQCYNLIAQSQLKVTPWLRDVYVS